MNVYFTYFCNIAMFIASDNICTKVTSKMLSSNTKTARHTRNCIVQSLEIFLVAHVRDKDCTNYQHTPLCSEV